MCVRVCVCVCKRSVCDVERVERVSVRCVCVYTFESDRE